MCFQQKSYLCVYSGTWKPPSMTNMSQFVCPWKPKMPCSRLFSRNCFRCFCLHFWSSFFPNNERWLLSQVCSVALPEMITCTFGQAPFPLKDIVSICCNDRIMASHLVLHPHFLVRTNTNTPAHVCTRTQQRRNSVKSQQTHKFLWLRGWRC